MKRETLVVVVKLVMGTSLSTKETAYEIRSRLKIIMMDTKDVKLVEAHMIGCMKPDQFNQGSEEYGIVN